jgi:hypothetical protein
MIDKNILDFFKVVGVSGLAGSGKDLFYSLCKKELELKKRNCCSVSIAGQLKKDIDPTIQEIHNFSLFDCDRNQKNLVRDHLVFYGAVKRNKTKGRHWIRLAEKTIQTIYLNCITQSIKKPILFITDVRYDEYPKDEVHWIREELQGILVHVKRYNTEIILDPLYGLPTGHYKKIYQNAPNLMERINDPKLQKSADCLIEWQTQLGSLKNVEKKLSPIAKDFVLTHCL